MSISRRTFIERTLRQIYGGQPSDDATITVNLVNSWLEDAIGVAAKTNYTDSVKLDGVAYINNSFYTKFKSLTISQDESFLWKITLPQIPFGIGQTEGIATVIITDGTQTSYPVILMSENQLSFQRGMREIPNKLLGYSEGEFLYIQSTILLNVYTANVTMVSGGSGTNLDSTLNIPADYFPVMMDYLQKQLLLERNMTVDVENDGLDAIKTT